MNIKQDINMARKPVELEQKYRLGEINPTSKSVRALSKEVSKKVDAIPGKSLSTNDFTNYYKSKLDNMINFFYPIGSIYKSLSATSPSFGGTWQLINKKIIDTGWQNFSWTNPTYINNDYSAWTFNKWRISGGVLHIVVGVACSSTINHSNEDEIARIPIKNGIINNDYNQVWTGAVGGGGAYFGFKLSQNSDYISIHIKPHPTSTGQTAGWYSGEIIIPLDDNLVIENEYEVEYSYKRTA